MNPIHTRFYKTESARDAALDRVKSENPDCIVKGRGVSDASRWSIEVWKPWDYLRKKCVGRRFITLTGKDDRGKVGEQILYLPATDSELVEAICENLELLNLIGLDKKVAGIRGANATADKVGNINRERIIAAYRKMQKAHPTAGKDWIQRNLAGEMREKKAGKIINPGLLPRLCLRTIKTHTKDL